MGVWACACVLWWDERCDGFKNSYSTFSPGRSCDFFDWICQSNHPVEKVESKMIFFDCVITPDLGFRKRLVCDGRIRLYKNWPYTVGSTGRKRPFRPKPKSGFLLKPILTQSDPLGPFPAGLFFDWILLGLLVIVRRVDFIVFLLFLAPVGVREYFCVEIESRLEALCLCFLRASVLRARRTLVQAGWR